jgi:hypothetical protein
MPSSSRSILLDRSPLKASRSPAGPTNMVGRSIGCMIAPARRCPPFRDRDSLTDHTEKGAACTSGEPPWPWPMPPLLVSRYGDLNLRHCTITYAGDGGRSADRDPAPCTYNLRLKQQVGAGRCRCVIRSILHQGGREVAKQFIFFLFLLAAAITVCWAASAMLWALQLQACNGMACTSVRVVDC